MRKTISLKLLLICIIFFSSISIAIITALILYFAGRSSLQTAIDLYSDLTIQVAVHSAERKLNNTYIAVASILNVTTRTVPDLYASNFTLNTALTAAVKNRFLVNDNWATAFVAVSCRYANGDGLFHRFVDPTGYTFTGKSNVAFWTGPTTTSSVDVILNQSRAAFNATSMLPVPIIPWPNFGSVSSTFVRGTLWNSSSARTPSQPQLVELPPTFASAGILGTRTPMISDMSIAGVRDSSIPLSPLTATSFCSMLIFLDELVLDLMASFGSLTSEVKGGGLRSVFLVDTVTQRVISHSLGTSSHFIINKTNNGLPLGFVPSNCFSSANYIGCFYNISTYAPYVDLRTAINAGLSINLPLRPHEVRHVDLEDDQIIAFVTPVSLLSRRFLLKMYLIISSSYFTQDLDSSLQFALGLSIGVAAVISVLGGYIGLKIALSDVEELSFRMQQDPWRSDEEDDRAESSEEATNSSGSAAEGKVGDKNNKPISSDDEQNVLGKDDGKNNSSTENPNVARQDAKKAASKKAKDSTSSSSSSTSTFSSSLFCILDETNQLRHEFNSFRSFINKIRGFMIASGSRHVTENPSKIFGIFEAASPTSSAHKKENEKMKKNCSAQNKPSIAAEFGDSIMESGLTVNEDEKKNNNSNGKYNDDSFRTNGGREEESMELEQQEEGVDSKPKKKKKALTFNLGSLNQDENETNEGQNETVESAMNTIDDANDDTEDDTASNLNVNQKRKHKTTFVDANSSKRSKNTASSPVAPSVKEATSAFSHFVNFHAAKSKTKVMTELFMVVHVKFMIIKKSANNKNNTNNQSNNISTSTGMKLTMTDRSQKNNQEISATNTSAKIGSAFAVSIYQTNKQSVQDKAVAESNIVQEVVDLDGNVVAKKQKTFPVVMLKRTSPGISGGQSAAKETAIGSYEIKTRNSDTTEVSASGTNNQHQHNKIIDAQNGLVDVSGYFELVDFFTDSSTTPRTPRFSTEDIDDDIQEHFSSSKSKVSTASVQLKQRTGKLIAKASDAIISHSGLSLVEFFGDSMLGCYRIKSLERKSLMTARLVNVLGLVQQWLATDDCEMTSASDFINEKLAELAKATRNPSDKESPAVVEGKPDEVKLDHGEVPSTAKINKKSKKTHHHNNNNNNSSVPPLPFSLKICASLVPGRLGLLSSDELVGISVASDASTTSKPLEPTTTTSLTSSINNISGDNATKSLFDLTTSSNIKNKNQNEITNTNGEAKNVHLQRAVTFLGPAVSLSKNIADQSPIGFFNRAEDMMRDFLASGVEAKRREITNRKGAKYRSNSRSAETASFNRVRSRLRKRMFADLELKFSAANAESSPSSRSVHADKINNQVGTENSGSPNTQRSRRSARRDDEIFDYLDLRCANSSVPFIVLPSNAFALVSEKCEVVSMANILLRGSSGGNIISRSNKDTKSNYNEETEGDVKTVKNKKDHGSSNFGIWRRRRNANADDNENESSSTTTSSDVDDCDYDENATIEKHKKRRLKYLESIKTSLVRILSKDCTCLFDERL